MSSALSPAIPHSPTKDASTFIPHKQFILCQPADEGTEVEISCDNPHGTSANVLKGEGSVLVGWIGSLEHDCSVTSDSKYLPPPCVDCHVWTCSTVDLLTDATYITCLPCVCPLYLSTGVPIVHLIAVPFPDVWHTHADNKAALHRPTIENLRKIFVVFLFEYFHLIWHHAVVNRLAHLGDIQITIIPFGEIYISNLYLYSKLHHTIYSSFHIDVSKSLL